MWSWRLCARALAVQWLHLRTLIYAHTSTQTEEHNDVYLHSVCFTAKHKARIMTTFGVFQRSTRSARAPPGFCRQGGLCSITREKKKSRLHLLSGAQGQFSNNYLAGAESLLGFHGAQTQQMWPGGEATRGQMIQLMPEHKQAPNSWLYYCSQKWTFLEISSSGWLAMKCIDWPPIVNFLMNECRLFFLFLQHAKIFGYALQWITLFSWPFFGTFLGRSPWMFCFMSATS